MASVVAITLESRLGYVRAQAQRYLDTIQLFVAMDGGWWDARLTASDVSELDIAQP